jgi:hypothetical protein
MFPFWDKHRDFFYSREKGEIKLMEQMQITMPVQNVLRVGEKKCGKCAQAEKLPVEIRIDLAISRVPGTPYICPVCKGVHSLIRF